MPKVLVCASTLVHLRNFHLPYLKFFKELGWEVHIAAPQDGPVPHADFTHLVPMAKSILAPRNVSAVIKMRRLLKEQGFDLLMSHAALAGFIARAGLLASGEKKTRVIHTSHGYFFWKGCSLFRKIVYYTPERLLRRVTDCVVAMNGEDYAAAKKLVKKGGFAAFVPGMGVDGARFFPADPQRKAAARKKLRIPEGAFTAVYPAEFSKRKNHAELLRAFAITYGAVPEALLLLCGDGKLQKETEALAERLGLRDRVRFLGWCDRMEEVYAACDLAVSSSVSEGLPFNIIEAQLCALPVVASRIRGHTDLIEENRTGLLYRPGDTKELSDCIVGLNRSPELRRSLGAAARSGAGRFTLEKAFKANTDVYRRVMESC